MIRPDNNETRKLAAEIVANGGLIAFRTDTFYGLGVDPFNASAVSRIVRLKGRDEGKPILLLISDVRDVDRLLQSKPQLFDRFIHKFWPGPLTMVAPAVSALAPEVTAGTGTVGLRLPDDREREGSCARLWWNVNRDKCQSVWTRSLQDLPSKWKAIFQTVLI
jgi:L-threonylcarbamoyladenylate synthase